MCHYIQKTNLFHSASSIFCFDALAFAAVARREGDVVVVLLLLVVVAEGEAREEEGEGEVDVLAGVDDDNIIGEE